MGLDMYLKASKYVAGYSFSQDQDKSTYAALLKAAGLELVDVDENTPSAQVEFTVAYWRKANAIHAWFIQNCAKGEDDCRPVYVNREQLKKLVQTCEEALAAYDRGDKANAEGLLTPTSGFFFGSTDIDEYYREDLENTIKQLNKVLKNPKFESWDFIYRASW